MADPVIPPMLWRRLRELEAAAHTGRVVLVLDMKQGDVVSGNIEAPANVVIESPPVVGHP